VYLYGNLYVATVVGGGTQDVWSGIAPISALSGSQINGLIVLNTTFSSAREAFSTLVQTFARLPPHSPGDYVIGASRVTTPFNLRILNSVLSKSTFYAVAR